MCNIRFAYAYPSLLLVWWTVLLLSNVSEHFQLFIRLGQYAERYPQLYRSSIRSSNDSYFARIPVGAYMRRLLCRIAVYPQGRPLQDVDVGTCNHSLRSLADFHIQLGVYADPLDNAVQYGKPDKKADRILDYADNPFRIHSLQIQLQRVVEYGSCIHYDRSFLRLVCT